MDSPATLEAKWVFYYPKINLSMEFKTEISENYSTVLTVTANNNWVFLDTKDVFENHETIKTHFLNKTHLNSLINHLIDLRDNSK